MKRVHLRSRVSLKDKLDLVGLDWTLLIMDIEESIDVDIDEKDATLYECDTVKDLVEYLIEKA